VVLDAKAMEWAAANDIDTKKLKAAKVPVYGKWYFPEIPPGELLVNLQTGELQRFGSGMRAGEVLYVPRDALLEARMGPYARLDEARAAAAAATAVDEPLVEPLDGREERPMPGAPLSPEDALYDQSLPAGERIHLPSPSIWPLVLGVGLAITMLGFVLGPLPDWSIARVLIVSLGLIYCIVAGFGWALEARKDSLEHEQAGEHG
jgi:hypothetical protein